MYIDDTIDYVRSSFRAHTTVIEVLTEFDELDDGAPRVSTRDDGEEVERYDIKHITSSIRTFITFPQFSCKILRTRSNDGDEVESFTI